MTNQLLKLFAVVALLLFMPGMLQAQYNYQIQNGKVTINSYVGSDSDVTIPSTLGGYPVTAIGQGAFRYKSVTNVVIPSSVITIGTEAFASSGLYNVAIGSGVTTIGDHAFANCFGLTSVTIPRYATNVRPGSFAGCYNLTNIIVNTLNTAYASVGGVLFDKNIKTLIQFPAGKAGDYTIPSGVTSIFGLNLGLSMGGGAFQGCGNLTSVTFPNSLTNINAFAFDSCSGLTNLTIPNSVISIGVMAFENCYNLISIALPNTLTSIGDMAFYHDTSLSMISVATNNSAFSSLAGILFDKGKTKLLLYPPGIVGDYAIPHSVTSIGNYAFNECANLTGLEFSTNLISIGTNAFAKCSSLASIALPNSLKNISDYAFDSCNGLASVIFGNSITNIGTEAFGWCAGLTNITFPKTLANIGSWAFAYCSSLETVFFLGNAPGDGLDTLVFGADYNATIYYLPGTAGWHSPFDGLPAFHWKPQIQTADDSFGVRTNRFGFNLNWASGQNVIVEASTNLLNWQPVKTHTLTTDTFYFSDPQWTNYPGRFYRLRSP